MQFENRLKKLELELPEKIKNRARKREESLTKVLELLSMRPVGRFAEPELTVLARELFWSLARLGKKHLATVLIGSGAGGVEIESAVQSWLRGASLAIGNR